MVSWYKTQAGNNQNDNLMKENINRIFLAATCVWAVLLAGCDAESPMDMDLYPPKVYIVGAVNKIVNRDLHIGNDPDTISVSVAVSGSRPSGQNVTVQLVEQPDAIAYYNSRELSSEVTHYQQLPASNYSYPEEHLTIKAGQVYGTFPIVIKPYQLHCDSLYMLPLKLKSTSSYELTQKDTIVLVRVNLVNSYSGVYYMDGVIRNTGNPTDTLVYKMVRNLKATDNGNTVRMYHYNNEFSEGDKIDYRPTHAFRITVNADNSLSFATWDQFHIIDGGGKYLPDMKLYDFWYTFNDNGVVRKTSGYLYKERKTTEEQRILDNWLEEKRKGR